MIGIIMFTGCEDDDVSYILQNISAPENLEAVFDVTQDDTGLVTITPSAEGASVFEVYFGDVEDETPTRVQPGSTAQNTYAEGDYQVRIVAKGLTGLTSELVQNLVIAFRTPENLIVDITQNPQNPAEVTVTSTADFATVFDVFFGVGEDEEPVSAMPGEAVSFTYTAPGEYQLKVIAKGAGAATVQFTQTIVVPEASDPVSLPITFDVPTVNYALGTFNGASFEVVSNPDLSGANTSDSRVGAITNAGVNFEGGAYNLGTAVDFSGNNKTIRMKFWSQVAVPVLLKFEGALNAERENEVVANHGGTGWELLEFDFATNAVKSFIDGNQGVGEPFVPTGQYGTVVIFVDGPGTTAGTFYIDDIEQVASSPMQEIPVQDFEGTPPQFTVFGNIAATEVIDNPDPSGGNTSAKVARLTKSGGSEPWAGTFFETGTLNIINNPFVKVQTWSPKSGITVKLKLENTDASITHEVDIVNTTSNAWEELIYDFSDAPAADYVRVVIFFDFGTPGDDSLYYYDEIILSANGQTGTPPLPLQDFEGTPPEFTVFGNIPATQVINNPDVSGSNTTANVAQLTKSAGSEPWAGTFFEVSGPLDLNTYSLIKVRTWSPKSGITVKLKLENADASITHEVDITNTTANAWEELSYDFSDAPAADYIRIVIFFDFGTPGDDSVYYFDEFQLAN